jgi:hypothetical protein
MQQIISLKWAANMECSVDDALFGASMAAVVATSLTTCPPPVLITAMKTLWAAGVELAIGSSGCGMAPPAGCGMLESTRPAVRSIPIRSGVSLEDLLHLDTVPVADLLARVLDASLLRETKPFFQWCAAVLASTQFGGWDDPAVVEAFLGHASHVLRPPHGAQQPVSRDAWSLVAAVLVVMVRRGGQVAAEALAASPLPLALTTAALPPHDTGIGVVGHTPITMITAANTFSQVMLPGQWLSAESAETVLRSVATASEVSNVPVSALLFIAACFPAAAQVQPAAVSVADCEGILARARAAPSSAAQLSIVCAVAGLPSTVLSLPEKQELFRGQGQYVGHLCDRAFASGTVDVGAYFRQLDNLLRCVPVTPALASALLPQVLDGMVTASPGNHRAAGLPVLAAVLAAAQPGTVAAALVAAAPKVAFMRGIRSGPGAAHQTVLTWLLKEANAHGGGAPWPAVTVGAYCALATVVILDLRPGTGVQASFEDLVRLMASARAVAAELGWSGTWAVLGAAWLAMTNPGVHIVTASGSALNTDTFGLAIKRAQLLTEMQHLLDASPGVTTLNLPCGHAVPESVTDLTRGGAGRGGLTCPVCGVATNGLSALAATQAAVDPTTA